MSTASQPKSKPCNRCGEQIIWNNNSHFFESLKIPKFQHCCPLKCNTCGGTIYFSNLCPKNKETNNKIPLDYPIPVRDPNDSAKMIWKVHVHLNKSTLPATDVQPQEQPQTAPATTVPETKPLDPNQSTLEYTPSVADTEVAVQKVRESTIAENSNQDVSAAILSTVNEMNQRLGGLEKYFNDVVPTITKYIEIMENVVPKLNAICGKIADGSIKNASDLVQHNLSEREEKNLQ